MIEKILDFHVSTDGTAYYQIKWKTSWERADKLAQFEELLDQFWNKVKKSSSANLFKNSSVNKKEPDIPTQKQQKTNEQPQTPTRRNSAQPGTRNKSISSPRTPQSFQQQQQQHQLQQQQQQQQFAQQQQQQQQFMQTQQLQQHQHPQQQQFQKAPNNQMFPNQSIGQTTPGGSAVTVIDSDEEDDIMQVNQQPMQFNPNFNGIKLEDIDQKPMMQQFNPQSFGLPPHQQQFMMNQPPNMNNSGGERGRGGAGSGRGRGRGRGSPAKRKLGMPPSGVGGTPPVKMEPSACGDVKTEGGEMGGPPTQLSNTANWKDHFEVLENFVDGQKVHSSYKCKICGTSIAQQSNCARHLKKHMKTV